MLRRLALALCTLFAAGEAQAAQWQPRPGTSFEWILQNYAGTVPASKVIDLDLFETSAARVAKLHAAGKRVVCYISAGSWEDYRPDKDAFPAIVIGKDYQGWPGEKWLDIRRLDILGPLIEARMDLCHAKGFDAVEPDNLDGYENDTGFPLTSADQLAFITWLADAAHRRGLSIGLKNVPEFIPQVLPRYDFAIVEDCFDQGWCGQMKPFITAGKAVFATEYTDSGISFPAFCAKAAKLKLSALYKRRALTPWSRHCP